MNREIATHLVDWHDYEIIWAFNPETGIHTVEDGNDVVSTEYDLEAAHTYGRFIRRAAEDAGLFNSDKET